VISLDTETCLFGPGNMAPPLVCVSTAQPEPNLFHRMSPGVGVYIRQCLNHGIVGHHVAYDMAVIAADIPQLLPAIFDAYAADKITDTMLREKLLDIADGVYRSKSYSLASVAKARLGIDLDKDTVRLRYAEMYDIPCAHWPEAFRNYAIDDAVTTYRVWQDQESRADLLADQYRQARAAFWIQLMSVWGITPDQERVTLLREQFTAKQRVSVETLLQSGLIREQRGSLVRNTKAAQAMIVRAYARKGVDHPVTATGAPELSREACQSAGEPALEAYADYSQLNALLSKDLPALDHPIIHARFESIVESGRTACSGPNLQNLPRKFNVRECLVPRPGHVFVVADYKGLELCTLAQVCWTLLGHSRLGEAINAGVDPHLMVAEQILGRRTTKEELKSEAVQNARQTGKVANFGFPGGLGAAALVHFAKQSYGVELSEDQARDLKRVWLETWPEMRRFLRLDRTRHGATRGDRATLFGTPARQCRVLRWLQYHLQGLGADIAKAAGFDLARWCYLESGARITLFVHDEFVVESTDPRNARAGGRTHHDPRRGTVASQRQDRRGYPGHETL
jgi:hypothetical protein